MQNVVIYKNLPVKGLCGRCQSVSGPFPSYRLLFPVPEFIDPVFAKTSPKNAGSMTDNERFWACFRKTGSLTSVTGQFFLLTKFFWCFVFMLPSLP